MQVLEGKYRRRRLHSSNSQRVRPTARRLREITFEILDARILDARLLDLCAGSGAIGIEALSRGASHVTFVDRSLKMCRFIETNLQLCGVPDEQSLIVQSEAVEFLRGRQMRKAQSWDVAFYDPPYNSDYDLALKLFGNGALLKRHGGVLVVEHHCERQFAEQIGSLFRQRVLRLGDSCLSFYESRHKVKHAN